MHMYMLYMHMLYMYMLLLLLLLLLCMYVHVHRLAGRLPRASAPASSAATKAPVLLQSLEAFHVVKPDSVRAP